MSTTIKFNNSKGKPLVLLSPLDWGLGHTTRCIPLIRELIILNCDILIACNSLQKELLLQEFPNLTYVSLPGYNIRYGRKKWSTLAGIFFQIPKILTKIKQENRWLRDFLAQHTVHAVISDNRFGLYDNKVPSVLLTHQLGIKSGLGKWVDALARLMNYRYIKRFTCCWVPDYTGEAALAGQLSNPRIPPVFPVQYLGNISRIAPCFTTGNTHEVLIILSGPEPQRSPGAAANSF